MNKATLWVSGCLVSLLSCPIWAAWQLDNSQSEVHFLSTKKSQITEVHQFKTLSGSLADDGKAVLEIDLSSVDTGIAIRDQRMQTHLFETNRFSQAKLTAELDKNQYKTLAVGESKDIEFSAVLSLHGQTQKLSVAASVFKSKNKQLIVTSRQPILLNAADFDLIAGLNKLQSLAALPSITAMVPVTFKLTFAE